MTKTKAKKKRGPGRRRRSPSQILGPKITRGILEQAVGRPPPGASFADCTNFDGCTDLHGLATVLGDALILPRCILGDREVAAEMLRLLKSVSADRDIKYTREEAIGAIAGYLKWDRRSLAYLLNRSKRKRVSAI
jgi:hypothetical protein